MGVQQSRGHHLEGVLPGLKVLRAMPLAGDGGRQSSIELVSVEHPDGQQRDLVVRSPQLGALGMDAEEDCARRVMSLYRTRDLPHCPAIYAVWAVDATGRTMDLRDIRSWHVAEAAVDGVPLSVLLDAPGPDRDLVELFGQLGEKLAGLHRTPKRPVTLSPSRGVRESLAGAEGAMAILADFPTAELRGRDSLIADYLAQVARLAWRLESDCDRPTASCHGDLHPGNILVDETGGVVFIDRSRMETCDPASDVASVLVNLIRIGLQPTAQPIDWSSIVEAFITSYDTRAPESWAKPLGYYLLTRMPAAVSPAFNPAVDALTRWKSLGWIHDLVSEEPVGTAGDWLAAITSIARRK